LARLPRYALPNGPQHVIQRGNNRSPLFLADADFLFFRDCVTSACAQHRCAVHAYVLMTNHVHLLLTPSAADTIPLAMQSIGRRYVQYFNSKYGRTGTLWEGRYRATVIDSDSYFLTCSRYIELNPVRARLVGNPVLYRWSSYGANAFGLSDALVTEHERYRALGADPEARRVAYRALFRPALSGDTLQQIRTATNKGWALGSDAFRRRIETLLDRQAAPRRPGRKRRAAADARASASG
jgi:putative transposase